MRISIFGMGYVGCVGLGCLASAGHRMLGVDPQQSKVDFINRGQATIIEHGIEDLIAEQWRRGAISATGDGRQAVRDTEVSFICVGTPSSPTGHLDLKAVYKVAEEIGCALKDKPDRHVVALRSTVLPGTSGKVSEIIANFSGKIPGRDFAVVANPEFLREGSSIEDFWHPAFTLVGTEWEWAAETLRAVYARIDAPFLVAQVGVAELMKFVCNSFHALKVTFANEVGAICKGLGVDSRQLMQVFCQDTRLNVSPAYLKPGFAYGGSCLPKDLRALRTIAHDQYLSCPVLESVERSNEQLKQRVFEEIQRLGHQKIGIVGLAFKSGTDDLRESPIIEIIERLLGKGFDVRVFDRDVHVAKLTGANRDYILQKIPFISRFITDDLSAVLNHADTVVVVNKGPGLAEALANLSEGKQVYDLAGVSWAGQGVSYQGIAW